MKARWHILRDGSGGLALCRHLPPRFDVEVTGRLPHGDALRFAHQIRQDLWRALQRVRGFSPVVELREDAAGFDLRVGGCLAGAVPGSIRARIDALLNNKRHRARWARQAQRGIS